MKWHKQSVGLATDDGMLRGELLLPRGEGPFPGAVLCHGFGSDHRAMRPCAQRLVRRGIAALTFDFRGHGRSGGTLDGNMERDVIAAADFMRHHPRVDANRLALVGHSMGAMAVMQAAGQLMDVQALVAISSPSEMSGQVERLLTSIYHKAVQIVSFIFEHPRHVPIPGVGKIEGMIAVLWMCFRGFRLRLDGRKSLEFWHRRGLELASAVEKLGAFPKLFVHCKGDRMTPYEGAMELYQKAGAPKELFLSKGGFHSTALLPGRLRTKWIAWLVSALT